MYEIHHWDTFDNETFQVGQEETLKEAEIFIIKKYGSRIRPDGADIVDIVHEGQVVNSYRIR